MMRSKSLVILSLSLPSATFAFFHTATNIATRARYSSYSLSLGLKASNGLFFQDIQVGDGETVSSGDQISIHYTGSFIDESDNIVEFENSRNSKVNRGVMGATEGLPIVFPIGKGKVIKGWEVGILGNGNDIPPMNVGGTRKLVIPADLAYGSEGRGVIPPDRELIFDVELTKINIETESFLSKFFRYGTPGIFLFLILNSIFLVLTGQA